MMTMTLDNALDTFITAKVADGRAERTIRDYRRCLDPFADWCNDNGVTIGNLTRDDVRQYIAHLRRDKSAATAAIHIRNIRTFLRWIWREGMTECNLAQAINAPRTYRREELPLSPDEIRMLLSACNSDDPQAVRDRALILFLLDTGLRTGEVVSIQREDVHLNSEQEQGWIRVYGSKNGQWRFVILGRRTCRALLKYLGERDDDLRALWVGLKGALTDRGIYHALKRRARAVGMEDRVHPHLFRKTFATHWLDNGGDPERLRVLMGWSTETLSQMLEIYVASQKDHLVEAHRRAGPVDNLPW